MSRLSRLIMAIALVFALLGLVGCGTPVQELEQDPNQEQGQTKGRVPVQSQSDSRINGQDTTPEIRVSFIDVGKGDCILIQAGSAAALIDAGYQDTANQVLSYLRSQGVSHLTCAIITHYDRDHIGGIATIGKSIPIDTIYLPGYEGGDKNYRSLVGAVDKLGCPSRQVVEETSLKLDGALLTIFPSSLSYIPGTKGEEGNDNDLSLVATLTSHTDSYLFCGDLEKEGIAAFLREAHGQFDVLKVPHHGQKNGNTDDLLESVRPKLAIITDDEDDPADQKTLNLLEAVGADTYRTSADGTVVVQSYGTGEYTVLTDKS